MIQMIKSKALYKTKRTLVHVKYYFCTKKLIIKKTKNPFDTYWNPSEIVENPNDFS